jgi:hypothetical protein
MELTPQVHAQLIERVNQVLNKKFTEKGWSHEAFAKNDQLQEQYDSLCDVRAAVEAGAPYQDLQNVLLNFLDFEITDLCEMATRTKAHYRKISPDGKLSTEQQQEMSRAESRYNELRSVFEAVEADRANPEEVARLMDTMLQWYA